MNNINSSLTKQELKIMERLSQGMTAKGVSHELGISKTTVHAHLVNVRRKFNCRNLLMLGYLFKRYEIEHGEIK